MEFNFSKHVSHDNYFVTSEAVNGSSQRRIQVGTR